MEQKLEKMAAEAARELRAYGRLNLKEAAKNAVKKALGRGTAKRDPAFWPAGMLALGLEEYAAYAERAGEEGAMADAAVTEFLGKWINGGAKVTYVDDALAGYVLLRRWERLTRQARACAASADAPAWDTDRAGAASQETRAGAPLPAAAGGTAQSASQQTEALDRLRAAADRIAAQFKALPRNADGAILYRPGRGSAYVFADGAGMAAMFLAKYGRLFGDAEAQLLAAAQLLAFLRCGMDDRSGLPYHGYERKTVKAGRESGGAAARAEQAMHRASAEAVRQAGEAECQASEACCKYGLIGWGRAVGWLLMGLRVAAECLPMESQNVKPETEIRGARQDAVQRTALRSDVSAILSPEDGAALRQGYRRLLEAALPYQRADGSFAWQLTAQEGPADTSATAMIVYATLGAEEAELSPCLRRAADFLNTQTDANGLVGGALAECLGFAEHPQRYGAFPWGQGAALAVGSGLAFWEG